MYRALMDEFAAIMGPDWDDDTQQAASQAMLLTTGVMRGAAQMAEGPARWTAQVVEKFQISGTWPWSGWWRRTGRRTSPAVPRSTDPAMAHDMAQSVPRSRPTSTARSSSMCVRCPAGCSVRRW